MSSAEEYIELCRTDRVFALKNEFKIRSYDTSRMQWNLVPFSLNAEQIALLDEIKRQEKEQGFVRIIIDKARKLGMSTFIQALKMHTCMFNPQIHALTVAHEESATRELFRIGKRIAENVDSRIGSPLKGKPKGHLLEWDNGSRAECQTQGGSPDSERGSTPNFLHISELPSWESSRKTTSAADVAQALLNAVPTTPNTLILIESTAMGLGNLFAEIWHRAIKNEQGNLFVPMFFPWTGRKAYSVPAPTRKQATQEARLDEQMRLAHDTKDVTGFHAAANELQYSQLQRDRAIKYNLSPDQIRFWQQTLVNACAADQDRFDQEWPVSWQVSFVASGRAVFSGSMLQKRIKQVEKQEFAQGSLVEAEGTVRLQRDGGAWQIYKQPEPDRRYVIGADAAAGGRNKDDDYSCIQVIDRATEEQVAEFYDKVPPDRLGDQMALAAKLYNNALCAPEANGPGLVTIHQLINKYPHCTIYRRFAVPGQVAGSETKLLGYNTNVKTRHYLFGQFESAVRRGEATINSQRLLSEMITLIRAKGTGRPEASPGYHDDACVAFAIALDVSRQQADMGIPSVEQAQPSVPPGGYSELAMPFDGKAPPIDEFAEGESSWF